MLFSPTAKARSFKTEAFMRVLMRLFFGLLSLVWLGGALPTALAEEFLDPEQAFQMSVSSVSPTEVDVHFKIAPKYYMYKERFRFELASPSGADDTALGAHIGPVQFPPATVVYDPTFEKDMEVYYEQVTVRVPVLLDGAAAEADGAADAGVAGGDSDAAATPLAAAAQGLVDKPAQVGPVDLVITSQGCADAGLCYSPITETVTLHPIDGGLQAQGQWVVDSVPAPLTEAVPNPADAAKHKAASSTEAGDGAAARSGGGAAGTAAGGTSLAVSGSGGGSATQGGVFSAVHLSDTGLAQYFTEAGLFEMVLLAFLLGLLLSFTVCVLPMVAILLSIIAGQDGADRGGSARAGAGKPGGATDSGAAQSAVAAGQSRRRGLAMAAVYVLGVSVVYTILGVAAGVVGASLAMWLQTPWVLISFAVILALLALSMFDVYTLQVPGALQARMQGRLNRLPAGRYGGVFLMGMLSALIVGPCVAAPLAGVLLFISQTGDLLLGGLTLFALAWGSGTLLLVVGASSSSLMPKAGQWMNLVKYGFGVLLLATAWWMLSLAAIVPAWLWVLGWALLAIWAALLLGLLRPLSADSGPFSYLAKALGGILAAWALLLVGGVGGGSDSVLRPLAAVFVSGQGDSEQPTVSFQRIESEAELDAALASTTRPVMLDFYADWCVSCIEMERFTFTDPVVAQQMQQL